MIYELDGHVCMVLRESGSVQYEQGYRYKATRVRDHGYPRDCVNDDRACALSDGYVSDVRGCVSGDRDYVPCIESGAFRSSIRDCDPSTLHVIHVHANLPSYSSQQVNAHGVNANNCDALRHAHHYEGFA